MRTRILVGSMLLVGVLTAGAFAAAGDGAAPLRQWAFVNLQTATLIKGNFVMGPVLFVHDEAKMAQGRPCSEVYRVEGGKPTELVVAFHCTPQKRGATEKFTLRTQTAADGSCLLREYQFAGDAEGHGVPSR